MPLFVRSFAALRLLPKVTHGYRADALSSTPVISDLDKCVSDNAHSPRGVAAGVGRGLRAYFPGGTGATGDRPGRSRTGSVPSRSRTTRPCPSQWLHATNDAEQHDGRRALQTDRMHPPDR